MLLICFGAAFRSALDAPLKSAVFAPLRMCGPGDPLACYAVNQVRASSSPHRLQDARPRRAVDAARSRRRGDRISPYVNSCVSLRSSASDVTRCSRSHTPTRETDWVGKSHQAPTPGPYTVVASQNCSCR